MNSTLTNSISLYEYYKSLGEKALHQTPDDALCWAPDEKSNSISVIIKHLHGNMLSRWTDFLTTDGEKPWRERDGEFEEAPINRDALMDRWDAGWSCLFTTLKELTPEDMDKIIYIRNMGQTVEDAIMRQLAHYAYHVGQIVYLARLANAGDWSSLTIPKGDSTVYNQVKVAPGKRIEHFTKNLNDLK
ncbi:MAG: DUF1572 family protein [Saprospiraceae bacterium]